ncbi:MAG: UV DNA damage repair endonuclease UvsE [Desulfofustis sp.]|nr:UV DNA damage repair endonuclease UvsE [Desulfofustis sp.]
MLRFGLCCMFREQPVSFAQTTARHLESMNRPAQLAKLSALCTENLNSLLAALKWIDSRDIRAFRVLSPLFPRYTHPDVGYSVADLPGADQVAALSSRINRYRREHDIRLSLHPDQFNVLSSPRTGVVEKTIEELEYQGMLAELIGAEVINIHGGGAYGDKTAALERFASNFRLLSKRVRKRLTLENDDLTYSPADLLPLCRRLKIPFVYDVHHHRCLPDRLTVDAATAACMETWVGRGQEPYFHISSPRHGWHADNLRPHADYIDPVDVPSIWLPLRATIDVEAKAKELAVVRLMDHFGLRASDA